MISSIKQYCDSLTGKIDAIPADRKAALDNITQYILHKRKENQPVNLVYICTHNSRRSHFGQVWAQVAANYYGINNVNTFSGGTEATAFNINAINSLKRIGFVVEPVNAAKNSIYNVVFDENEKPVVCYSKVYNDPKNPQKEFAAIITCSDAEENCPLIPGAEMRIGTSYNDPKASDNTPQQDATYDERCKQIALETFYVFSKVK